MRGMLLALLALLSGCDAENDVVLAQKLPEVAKQHCAYVVAHRAEVQVGWHAGDVTQLLGTPDYENTALDGTTSMIYNASCGSFEQQLVVKVRNGYVTGAYW